MGRFDDKSIVVTGASSGMGYQIVKDFAAEGGNVIAVARRAKLLEALATELADAPGKVVAFSGDVSKREDCEAMIDRAVEEFGRLDILVNCAGVMDSMSAIATATDEKYDYVMGINAYGPFAATRKAVQVFLAQGDGGSIVNISSFGANHKSAGVIYGMSKAACSLLTEHVAFTYAKDGIRCNAVEPGPIQTDIGSAMGEPDMDGYSRIKCINDLIIKWGEPKDISNAVLFLSSDESAFINGVCLPVDAGWGAL